MVLADVEAELLGRIVEVTAERQVGDGRARAEQEWRLLKPLVEDGEVAVDAPFQKRQYGLVRRGWREILQESVGAEIAIDLLVVEDDPAQRFHFLVLPQRL